MIPPLWLEDPNLPWFKPNRFSFSIPSQSYQYPANDISISSDIHFTNLVAGFKPEKYARQWRPSSSERWKREHHSNDPPDHHWLHTHYVRWWNHHFWWLTSTFFHFWISTSPALHCPNKFLPPFEDLLPCGHFGIFFAQFDITMIWRTESEWRQPFYKTNDFSQKKIWGQMNQVAKSYQISWYTTTFLQFFAVSGISWILETIFFGFLEDVWFLKRTSLSY